VPVVSRFVLPGAFFCWLIPRLFVAAVTDLLVVAAESVLLLL